MGVEPFIDCSYSISRLITKRYSTSFSLATSMLEKEKKQAVYAIYGFVRLADEIVDSLLPYDRNFLFEELNSALNDALKSGMSSNPVLTSFVDTVNHYEIPSEYIHAFMDSMRADLSKSTYTRSNDLQQYIYGSADVVGLMCLKVFCAGNKVLFDQLKDPAQKLGSAFQKVNFLRDIKEDTQELGRLYFPEMALSAFDEQSKLSIERSIEADFKAALPGVRLLPGRSRLAVALAFYYYYGLFQKIQRADPNLVLSTRMRISNLKKYYLIVKVGFLYKTKCL